MEARRVWRVRRFEAQSYRTVIYDERNFSYECSCGSLAQLVLPCRHIFLVWLRSATSIHVKLIGYRWLRRNLCTNLFGDTVTLFKSGSSSVTMGIVPMLTASPANTPNPTPNDAMPSTPNPTSTLLTNQEKARFLSMTQRIVALNFTAMMNKIVDLRAKNVAAATTMALIVQGAYEIAERRIDEQLATYQSRGLPDFLTREMIQVARSTSFRTSQRARANELAVVLSDALQNEGIKNLH